jgi:hypothetical protein
VNSDCPTTWPCHHLAPDESIDAHMWLVATVNASTWLHQSAAGDVPHGGITYIPKETPVDEPIDFSSEDMMPLSGDA